MPVFRSFTHWHHAAVRHLTHHVLKLNGSVVDVKHFAHAIVHLLQNPITCRERQVGNHDVVAIGNAIVDVLAKADEAFLTQHKLTKGAMTLIDAPTAGMGSPRNRMTRSSYRPPPNTDPNAGASVRIASNTGPV